MFNDTHFQFSIIAVLKFSWGKREVHPKVRPFNSLSFRVKGNADLTQGKKTWHTGKDGLLFVPKGCEYHSCSHEEELLYTVHFDTPNVTFAEVETFTPVNAEVFQRLFEKAYDCWCGKRIGYEHRLNSLFSRILEAITIQNFQIKNDLHQDFLELIDFIHSNFTDHSITVKELAERLNVSGTYLRKLFAENLQTTPLKYLTELRVSYATSLLQSGYYTVEEAAEAAGFVDAKYFSTVFKKTTGDSPGNVKKRGRTPFEE